MRTWRAPIGPLLARPGRRRAHGAPRDSGRIPGRTETRAGSEDQHARPATDGRGKHRPVKDQKLTRWQPHYPMHSGWYSACERLVGGWAFMMPEMNLPDRIVEDRVLVDYRTGMGAGECPAATGQCEPHRGVARHPGFDGRLTFITALANGSATVPERRQGIRHSRASPRRCALAPHRGRSGARAGTRTGQHPAVVHPPAPVSR